MNADDIVTIVSDGQLPPGLERGVNYRITHHGTLTRSCECLVCSSGRHRWLRWRRL